MGTKYKHLTKQDRVFLRIMLEKRYPKNKIAKILGVHRTTIYREIKRNSTIHSYSNIRTYYGGSFAHNKYLARRKKKSKIENSLVLAKYVLSRLKKGWSPWQIEGRLKLENNEQCLISHEAIYRYIYSNYNRRNRFYKCLRRKHHQRIKLGQRKSRFPKKMLISSRPETINNREDFGHWEGDLMLFKQGTKTNLITLRERKTRFIIAIKNLNKSSSGTAIQIIAGLKSLKLYVKSITFDQGSEFRKYHWIIDCIKTDIYFCNPGSPYQKGSVENGNGIIRVEYPRDCSIKKLKQTKIDNTVGIINDRPLKCLGYSTPLEEFQKYINSEY